MIPYPIYFNKRLIKTVFVVRPKDLTKDVFKNIFDFNFHCYGGRFNPIIFSDGKDFSKEGWEFIKDFDPDIINFLIKPKKALVQKIEDRLSPYLINISEPQKFITSYDEVPRINRPSADLIKRTSTYFQECKPLVLFNIKDLAKEELKQFISFNFGIYEDYLLDQIGKNIVDKKLYTLTDEKSVDDSLVELGNIHKSFVFPIQFSSIPNETRDVHYDINNENFTVIVGDSPYELEYYWNRNIIIPQWMRLDICHIWLPTKVAENKKLREGLQQFIQQRASRTGNNNNGKFLQFVSFSLGGKRLKKIADTLGQKAWYGKKVMALEPKEIFPNYGPNKDFFNLRQGMNLHQAHSNEETIVIDEMIFPEGVQPGNWMLDAYIQYRPERYQYTNLRHWWRLPNRNNLTRLFFPSSIGRIQKNGIPSVLMGYRSSFNPDELKLDIKISNDKSIISNLIFGQNIPIYTRDIRAEIIDRKTYFDTQRSDKGRYMAGVISLFGELSHAYNTLRDPYWRRVFEILSISTPASDEQKKIAILGKLKNTLRAIPKDKSEREAELKWLSEYILMRSKEHGKSGREAGFDFFLKEKLKLVQEFLKAQGKNEKIDKKKALQFKEEVYEDIKGLVESNILLMGLKPHCPSCGYANWLQVDEIKQKPECKGCGAVFNLEPEAVWLYRLNSLIESAVRQHGLVPVLLTLGELQDDARSSFIYSPSLDLFKKNKKNYKHIGDLDVLCIQDGKFIMGEIKQSASLFTKNHFEEALKLAKQIKPNILLFSSFDDVKTNVIENGIKMLKQKLESLEIQVEWYEPHKIGYHY